MFVFSPRRCVIKRSPNTACCETTSFQWWMTFALREGRRLTREWKCAATVLDKASHSVGDIVRHGGPPIPTVF